MKKKKAPERRHWYDGTKFEFHVIWERKTFGKSSYFPDDRHIEYTLHFGNMPKLIMPMIEGGRETLLPVAVIIDGRRYEYRGRG